MFFKNIAQPPGPCPYITWGAQAGEARLHFNPISQIAAITQKNDFRQKVRFDLELKERPPG
jgi:hypothetical protein